MKKERNAVNAFAKECIATALIKLMKEKKYEEITITDIAKTAGVSRVTYYRNYNSKDDIIIHYMEELAYQLHQETKHLNPVKDIYECTLAMFHYWLKHRDFLLCLNDAKLGYVLLDHINQYITRFTSTAREKYEACYYLGSMHNILFEWIKGGAEEEPEEMAEIVCGLFRVPLLVAADSKSEKSDSKMADSDSKSRKSDSKIIIADK